MVDANEAMDFLRSEGLMDDGGDSHGAEASEAPEVSDEAGEEGGGEGGEEVEGEEEEVEEKEESEEEEEEEEESEEEGKTKTRPSRHQRMKARISKEIEEKEAVKGELDLATKNLDIVRREFDTLVSDHQILSGERDQWKTLCADLIDNLEAIQHGNMPDPRDVENLQLKRELEALRTPQQAPPAPQQRVQHEMAVQQHRHQIQSEINSVAAAHGVDPQALLREFGPRFIGAQQLGQQAPQIADVAAEMVRRQSSPQAIQARAQQQANRSAVRVVSPSGGPRPKKDYSIDVDGAMAMLRDKGLLGD